METGYGGVRFGALSKATKRTNNTFPFNRPVDCFFFFRFGACTSLIRTNDEMKFNYVVCLYLRLSEVTKANTRQNKISFRCFNVLFNATK